MSDLTIYLTIGVFAGVILAIAFDLIDMAVAALLGVCILLGLGVLDSSDLLAAAVTAGGPLSLLFGGMVVARVLARTGVFQWVGDRVLRATRGSGRRYLLLLIALVAPVCAFLPNATAVILVAPVIVGERVTFVRFVRYGLPITLVQLAVGALYVLALAAWID